MVQKGEVMTLSERPTEIQKLQRSSLKTYVVTDRDGNQTQFSTQEELRAHLDKVNKELKAKEPHDDY